jgi:hypothetical protein
MKDEVFKVFLETLAKASFSRDKMGTIEQASHSNHFTFPQTVAIISKLSFSKGLPALFLRIFGAVRSKAETNR